MTAVTFIALQAGTCWAVDPARSLVQLDHTSWTARSGAPSYVQTIAQTDDGFLWLATRGGLVRFDGVRFEHVAAASGAPLPGDSIRALLAVPGNGLLIGWTFGNATLLRDGEVTDFGEAEGYPPGTTYQFLADGSGHWWAATSSALTRFDGRRWHRVGADWNFADQRAIAMFLTRDGTMGVFTETSLLTLAKDGTSFRPTRGATSTRVPIVQAPDGTLYLSTMDGIRSIASLEGYDRPDRSRVYRSREQVDAQPFVVDRDGGLWIGGDHGVTRIPRPDRRPVAAESFSKPEGLSDSNVSRVFEDREGSIWVATAGGIDRFRRGSFVPPSGALRAPFASMLPGTDGGVRFAGFGSSLREVTRDGEVRENGRILVTCAYREPDGVAWYASKSTRLLRDDGRGNVTRVDMPSDMQPGLEVQALSSDASGAVWVSVVRRGVYRLARDAWEHPSGLPEDGKFAAVVMTRDKRGGVWLGYLGNRVVHWDDGRTRSFGASEGVAVGNVLTITEKGDHLWIAGEDGVALLVSDRFVPLTVAEPDVLRGVTGLVETEDGDLWIHASRGAVLVRAAEVRRAIGNPGSPATFRLFDDDDGLTSVPTAIRPLPTLLQAADGRLWFATYRGLFALDPKQIVVNTRPPTVVINDVVSDGKRQPIAAGTVLPAGTSNLQIDYAATSLTAPRRVRFRYRLEGVDHAWQEAGDRRQAFYTNLAPKPYRFTVIAANEDGLWNSDGATLAFSIAPAWYQTLWFGAACVVAVCVLLALLYRKRMADLRADIQGRLQERLLERERIARDLHDTLLQGFQGLLLTFEAAMRRIPAGHPARQMMETALVKADRVVAQGRDRVRDLRDTFGLAGDLVSALGEAAHELAATHASTFSMSVRGMARSLHPVVLEEVFLIAREALTNAFRHAAASGIEVEVVYAPRELRVRITDDGKGIPSDVLADGGIDGHWGIAGMRERAAKIDARLMLRSGAGAGTQVDLEVPAAVAYRDRPPLSRWFSRLRARDHEWTST